MTDDVEVYRTANYPPTHHKADIPDGKLENMHGINTMQPVVWTNEFGKGKMYMKETAIDSIKKH